MDTEILALIQYVLLNSDKFDPPNYQKGRTVFLITLATFPVVLSNFNNVDFGIQFLLPAKPTLYNFAVSLLLTHGSTRKFISADDEWNMGYLMAQYQEQQLLSTD
jgi:hypothetical protein